MLIWIVIVILLKGLSTIVPVLLAVAFLTLFERKLMALVQRRRGPNVVGLFGLLQPFADGLKLIIKESVIPTSAHLFFFVTAPVVSLFLAFIFWSVIPFSGSVLVSDINPSILFIFAISSMGVYTIILAGWSSNSKYAFLGALRAAAQMISYEVSIGLIVIVVLMCAGSLNLTAIVEAQYGCWYILPLLPAAVLFFNSILAETNRPPFDLPEAEGELVAGYGVEYSAAFFALFFIAEYCNIIFMSVLFVLFFFGGWLIFGTVSFFWFVIKVFLIIVSFVMIRAVLPRYRYDQLMYLG